MAKFDKYCKAWKAQRCGIIRIAIVLISFIVFCILLGGGLHYEKINAREMQMTEVLQVGTQGNTYSKDFGAGLGKMAFERGFSLDSEAADKFEKFQLWDNNPDLKMCYGRYKEQDKLYDYNTADCGTVYIPKVGECDEKAVDGLQVPVSEYDHDVYIEDNETRRNAGKKAYRERGGLSAFNVIGAFGIFIIGVLVALTTKEKRACYLVALSALPFIIVLGAIGQPPGVEFDDWIECKGMEDLRYYGSEPASTCYVKNQNKLIWYDILKRDEVERVDAECSGLSKRKCKGDCEWVTSNEQSEAETRTLHYKKALTENTCRSKLLTGYNVWGCDDVEKLYWETSGVRWQGTSRKRLNKAVRSTDGASLASVKESHNNFKLSTDMCLKRKSSNCVTDFLDLGFCRDMCSMTSNPEWYGHSHSDDIIWGPMVPVWRKISGHRTHDPDGLVKERLDKWAVCTAEEIAYVELAQGFKKKEKDDVPLNCLSNQDGGQRSKFMDRRLNRKRAVDTCFVIYILLTVVDILLIFALLMLEIMPYKKEHINVTAAGIANPRAPNNGIQMTNQPINNMQVTRVTAAGIANPRAANNGIQMTNQPINNTQVTRAQNYRLQTTNQPTNNIPVTIPNLAVPGQNHMMQMTNQPINNIPVTIPNGAVPGQILQIQTPQGNAIQVQVPEGAVPGQIVMVKSG